MTRRSFFKWLGSIGVSIGLLPIKTEAGYWYDWQVRGSSPCSNDPAFANRPLPYGGPPTNRVFLNGKDVTELPIVAIKTGPNGWIVHGEYEYVWNIHLKAHRRRLKLTPIGQGRKREMVKRTKYGHVRYEYRLK